MTEMRESTWEQALERLLEAVEEVLCSCLWVEHREEATVDGPALLELEESYDTVLSFADGNAAPETDHVTR